MFGTQIYMITMISRIVNITYRDHYKDLSLSKQAPQATCFMCL